MLIGISHLGNGKRLPSAVDDSSAGGLLRANSRKELLFPEFAKSCRYEVIFASRPAPNENRRLHIRTAILSMNG